MNIDFDKSDWKKTKLDDVVFWYQKNIPNESMESEGISNYVTANDIDSDCIAFHRYGLLSDGQKGPTVTKHFEKGDFLISTRSVALRKAALAPVSGVTGEKLLVLRVKENSDLVPELLPFICHSNDFWKYAQNSASGSVNKFTSWTKLRNYEFLLPPKAQQAEIAELLWAMDEIIQKSEAAKLRIRTLYEAKREDDNFLVKKGEQTEINSRLKGEVNSSLRFRPLGDALLDIKYGTSKKGNSEESGYPTLGIPNVINEILSLEKVGFTDLTDKEFGLAQINQGEIVIVRTNGNPEYTGRSALFDAAGEYAFASYLIKIALDNTIYDPEFVVRYLQTNMIRRFFKRHATSTAGNYNINTEVIKKVPVPIVSLRQQQSIVSVLKKIEGSCMVHEEQLVNAKSFQKSLINQVF